MTHSTTHKERALEWYLDLATLMREEDKAQIGHIDHTLHLINDLNDLHLRAFEIACRRGVPCCVRSVER